MNIFKRIKSRITMEQGEVEFEDMACGTVYNFVDCYGIEWLGAKKSFWSFRILKQEFDDEVDEFIGFLDDEDLEGIEGFDDLMEDELSILDEIMEDEEDLDVLEGFEGKNWRKL